MKDVAISQRQQQVQASTEPPSDDELMAIFCAAGPDSSEAFDTLYARYKDKTWRYFCRGLYSKDTGVDDPARDAQQQLWLKLIERRHQYRPENRFAGYLFSIANSILVDTQRKSLRTVDAQSHAKIEVAELKASAAHEPPRASRLQNMLAALSAAIAALPISQRNTFVMYQESGMSYAEIAAATDTTTETVKSRLRYARKKLAADLEEELEHVEL